MTDTPNVAGDEKAQAQTQEQPKHLTAAAVAQIVNGAITGRENRLIERLKQQFAPVPAPKADEPAEQAAAVASDGKPKTIDPELVRMKQQLEAQSRALEAERTKREAAEKKQREERALSMLQASISGKVRPEAVGMLVKAMRSDIVFDEESGEPRFPYEHGYLEIPAYVETWAKSKEAAIFLPAPAQGGSGSTASRSAGSSNYRSKPRSQWTDEDYTAAFNDRQRENAAKAI